MGNNSHDPGESMKHGGRKTKSKGQGSQEVWTKWDLPKRKITWRWEPFPMSFLLRSVIVWKNPAGVVWASGQDTSGCLPMVGHGTFPTRSRSLGRTHCRDCIPASPTLGSLEELVQSARREDSLVFIPTDNALYESDLNKEKATRYVVPMVCGIVVGCC